MRFRNRTIRRWVCFAIVPLIVSGCVLAPKETKNETARMNAAGKPFEPPVEKREIPELPAVATWQDVLHRAFLVNGELESAYFQWKAALARIPQVANYPNTNLAPSFSYLFSPGKMKTFDRTTTNVGFDSMENLSFPTKVAAAGKIALDDAQAAGKKFEATKFDIQKKVLALYLDICLMDEKIRIQRSNADLLKMLAQTAADRVRAGGSEQDLLRAQTQYRLAENDVDNMQAEHMSMKAMLNGMLARDATAPLNHPPGLPPPRLLPLGDARLIELATDNNPELAQLAHEVKGREDALSLAKMGFIPDFNPFAGFNGSMSQTVGATIILPTTIPEIRGRIDESRAMLRSSQAMLRQTKSDRAASFVAALYVMRNAERQANVYENTILPRAEQTLASSRQAYTTGAGTYSDLVDSQRMLLEVRQVLAEVRIEREKQLAELEALAGVDIETLVQPATLPSTFPSTSLSAGARP